jgi:hypothetical protein
VGESGGVTFLINAAQESLKSAGVSKFIMQVFVFVFVFVFLFLFLFLNLIYRKNLIDTVRIGGLLKSLTVLPSFTPLSPPSLLSPLPLFLFLTITLLSILH